MGESQGASKFTYFFIGVGVGAVIALLYAPKAGRETRKFIARTAEDGRDYVLNKSREIRESAEELIDKGRKAADEWSEKGKTIVSKLPV